MLCVFRSLCCNADFGVRMPAVRLTFVVHLVAGGYRRYAIAADDIIEFAADDHSTVALAAGTPIAYVNRTDVRICRHSTRL